MAAILAVVSMAAWAQAPSIASVVNAEDYSSHYCPGLLVFLYGANFGSSTSALSITVGGKPAFIAGSSSTLIEAQIPFELSPGPTTLVLTVAGSQLPGIPMNLTATAPAFSSFDSSGSGSVTTTTAAGALVTSTAPANPGDTVVVYLSGLGATNPPTPSGQAAKAAPPAATPTLTVGGQNASITSAVLAPGYAGLYQVAFKVPAGVQGNAPIALSIGGVTTSAASPTNPLTIPIFGITYIENNASFASPGTASGGAIVSLFGNGFGTSSQSTGFPATTFQGVSVTFNGTPAPLFHLTNTPAAKATATTSATLGASQIDLLVPYELPATGTVQVAVKTASATSPNYALTMAAATPGMYYIQDPSTATRFNILAQFNQTAWLDMPAAMATALKIPGGCAANNDSPLSLCGQPAAPGDYMVLYATGLGLTTPNGDPNGKPLMTGQLPPADGSVLFETVATPTLMVGGFPAKILFSGLAPGFPGEYQIDFQVPTGVTGDDVPVVLSISGSPADTRSMSIQPKAQ